MRRLGRHAPHRSPALTMLLALVVLTLSACAPGTAAIEPGSGVATQPGLEDPRFDTPAAREVERAAREAFHRMEIGRLQLGVYTTNVLVDLDLPRGARVTVEAFGDDDYRLRFTSDAALEAAWLVSPRGVERTLQ